MKSEIEIQIEKDRIREKEKAKRKAFRAQKMEKIDQILKEKLDATPWNPVQGLRSQSSNPQTEVQRAKKTLNFCEPLDKRYDFDQNLDRHQQHVVTNCIKNIGLFDKEYNKSQEASTGMFKELHRNILQNVEHIDNS